MAAIVRKATLIAIALLCCATPAWAQCGVYKTWAQNEILTSQDINAAFQRTVDANTPICSKGYSASVSQMQIVTNPYPGGAESRATTMAGELERIRFQLKAIVGKTQWYHVVDNSLAKGTPKDVGTSYTKYKEIGDPAAPLVDELALYAKDDGAGSTVLAYIDHNGVVNTLSGPSTSFGNAVTMNLHIRNNAATPNTKIDLKADRISVAGFIKSALNVTIDGAGVGANGLDAGSLTADTLYYIHLIYRPTTPIDYAGLLSTSETAPVMPTGYTKRRLLGAFRTNASSQFVAGVQRGRLFTYETGQCESTVNQSSGTQVDFPSCIPNQSAAVGWFGMISPGVPGSDDPRAVQMHWTSFSAEWGNPSASTGPGALPKAPAFWGLPNITLTGPVQTEAGFNSLRVPLNNASNRSTVFVAVLMSTVRVIVTGWEIEWPDS